MYEKTKLEPQALATKPDLPFYLTFSVRVFNHLHTRRFTEVGIRPIAIPDILAYIEYFELYDLDLDDKERLLSHIVSMDSAYMGHRTKLKKLESDGNKAKSNR